MLTRWRRGVRTSKVTGFASSKQSVKILVLDALLGHLEADHKKKQGNPRKNSIEGQVNSRQALPSKGTDSS